MPVAPFLPSDAATSQDIQRLTTAVMELTAEIRNHTSIVMDTSSKDSPMDRAHLFGQQLSILPNEQADEPEWEPEAIDDAV